MRARPLLIGIGVTVVTLAGIVVFAMSRVDPADYVPVIAAKIKAQTGRELAVDGKIGYTISLVPTVSVEAVRFQNAPWGTRPDMLTVKRVEVAIALLPLLSGKVDVRGLTLIEPDVLLETDAKGKGNWEFDPADAKPNPAEAERKSQGIDIRQTHLENGLVTYKSARDKKERKLEIASLNVKDSGNRMQIELDARLNAEALQVQATVERDVSPIKLEIHAKSAGMTLAAKTAPAEAGAKKESRTSGQFDLEVRDWNTVARLAGSDPVALPGLKASGTLRSTGDAWIVDGLKANLGKSNFTGTIRVGTGKPEAVLDIKLESSFVDLAELQGPPKKAPRKDGRVFSNEPLPIESLKAFNGKIEARIARLALKDGKAVDGVEFQAIADRGRINADPVRLRIEGRELGIRANLDASSGKTLAADVGIDGTGISLGALGALLNLSGTPEGSPTDINIRFAGRGNSMRTLMADANADVRIVVGPGRLQNRAINWGADVTELLNALNPARASEPYTELKCAVVRLPIRQGVARIDNSIAAETAKVNVIAAGVIDLRNEALDLGFRTKAATGLGIGLGGLASLARLRGSLADPKVELDMSGTAQAAAQLGLAAATGGLSLLAGGLLSERVPDRPCQVALTGATRAQDGPRQEQPGIVDSVVGGIKKLFGR